MSQTELQEDVQRVASVLMDRVAEVVYPLVDEEDHAPLHREALMRRALGYSASALDIAVGPAPELNTLDMLVFTVLCRDALERHWIPQRLGSNGQPFVSAFRHAEDDLWEISAKFLSTKEQDDVRELIATWQTEHAGQFRVENVRFLEFSAHAGQIANERAAKSRGLLGHVRSATAAADQALLISERAFFLAQHMPFLMRLQARVGAHETLSDSLARLHDLQREVRAAAPHEIARVADVAEQRVDRIAKRLIAYVLGAGLAWAVFFWIGYAIVKRLSP
jgi:hypothetical protein